MEDLRVPKTTLGNKVVLTLTPSVSKTLLCQRSEMVLESTWPKADGMREEEHLESTPGTEEGFGRETENHSVSYTGRNGNHQHKRNWFPAIYFHAVSG